MGMKIGMVHLDLGVESGDPRMFYHIAQGIKRAGHDVVIYTARFDTKCFTDLHAGLRIIVVGDSSSFAQSTNRGSGIFGAIRARLSRNRFQDEGVDRIKKVLPHDLDILICQNDRSYKLGNFYKTVHPEARVVWVMNNAPFYSERKSTPLLTLGSRINATIEKWQVKRAIHGIDLIVVHDEERRKLGVSLGKPTVLLPIPVDFESFYHPVKIRVSNDRHVTLIGIGSLSPTRKFEDIVSAGALLRSKGYDACIILICHDVRHDIGYRKLLLNLVRDTGMKDRVTFYFEGVSEAKLHELQQAADFFVFPNHFNIWSMASFESMAAGLPLLVSRVTSVAEAVKDGAEAILFNHGDSAQIANVVESLISDPERYHRVATAGQAMVKRELGWHTYITRLLAATQSSA